MNNYNDDLINKGYTVIRGCVSSKILNLLKKEVKDGLQEFANFKKKKQEGLGKTLEIALKKNKLHEIQKEIAKNINNKEIIIKMLNEKKITEFLNNNLGPDIEYCSNSELAINKRANKNPYFLKDYHQEIWSGVSLSSLLFWIPIFCKKGMSTLEVIEESHKWGHIPHRDRKPVELPKKLRKKIIKISEGSILVMTPLTLHRSLENFHNDPRVAFPFTLRNFYYPKIGNEDLWEFKKVKLSYYSKFRKVLGNPYLSPFRTLNQKREIFKNNKKK